MHLLYFQVIILEIILVVSLYLLSQYFLNKKQIYRKLFKFIIYFVVIYAIFIYYQLYANQSLMDKFDLKLSIWFLCGFIMACAIYIKIKIIRTIFMRRKNSEFVRYNVLGGKVVNQSYVSQEEFKLFLLTIPFFLLPGSYFVARIINLILYGRF